MKVFQILLLAGAAALLARRAGADAPLRHKIDVKDLANMSVAGREQFERGEALLERDDFAAAADLFQQVTITERDSAITFRRLCEALSRLGRRDEALAACMGTLSRGGSAMDFRAYAGALTSGDNAITPSDMAQAVVFARRARELLPDQPWGYAAQCDIAHRLGDTEMFNECTKELQRVAPGHFETRRALARAASRTNGLRVSLGWLSIALACMGTAVHAVWRARIRSLARANVMVLGACLFGALTLHSGAAQAQEAQSAANSAAADAGGPHATPGHFSKWDINDDDPIQSIPADDQLHKDPLQFGYYVMDLSDRADKALQRGDHAAAVKFWLALAKITPDRSHAFSKMCASYEAMGAWEKAVYSCGAALGRTGATLKDHMRYVGLLLSKKGNLSSEELAALDQVLDHLRSDASGKGLVDELACRIGARLKDAKRLEPCTASLMAFAPNHPNTVYFQWALAAARGRGAEARRLIDRAQEVSVKSEDIQHMKKETERIESRWKSQLGVGAGLLVVIASAVALFTSRQRSLKMLRGAGPSNAAA